MNLDSLSHSLANLAPALKNHLWQSTIFAVVAALLTLALRHNQARTRYWLWLAASLKFLVPLSMLVSLGSHLAPSRPQAVAQPALYFAMEQATQPFTPTLETTAPPAPASHLNLAHLLPTILAVIWLCGFSAILLGWLIQLRRIAATIHTASPAHEGRELDALRRIESLSGATRPTRLLLSPASLEPGIFGIFRPTLLWPVRITEHLEDAHLDAILAHELCHVRRRDNLTAALHMLVSALFWFHPLVWFLGARLLAERERACDEAVLHLSSQPRLYAESILKVCEFCLESPLPCVSGVAGANLKSRISTILTNPITLKLSLGRKLLLLAVGMAVVAVPIMLGQTKAAGRIASRILAPPASSLPSPSSAAPSREDAPAGAHDIVSAQTDPLPAPKLSFEVVAVRPSKPGTEKDNRFGFARDGLHISGWSLDMLLAYAYQFQFVQQRVVGGPEWARSQSFDIQAKVDASRAEEYASIANNPTPAADLQRRAMLLALLTGQFKLKTHTETREGPIYALLVAEGGPKLRQAASDELIASSKRGHLSVQSTQLSAMAPFFAQELGQPVIDKTGLTANYDFTLDWTPQSDMSGDSSAPSIFTAVQEQLGLKLEAQKGPVEYLVVDHAEKPSMDEAELPNPPTAALKSAAFVQEKAPPQAQSLTFEVVSIRQNKSGGTQAYAPTPDGWSMTNMPLGLAIILADVPRAGGAAYFTPDQIKGLPDWVSKERYDIAARVSEADLPEWRKPASQAAMLRVMLQAMLAERCELAVHHDTKEVLTYSLVVGKNGPKFKETDPADPHPGALPFPGGAVMVPENSGRTFHFYAATMASLTPLLSSMSGRPVKDETGLTAKYDFPLQKPATPSPPPSDGAPAPEDGRSIFSIVQDLGLKLEPAKGSVETLVIDRIERPSEN